MMKVFYSGLGYKTHKDNVKELLESSEYNQRAILKGCKPTQYDGIFYLPENIATRFNQLGNATVIHLLFDDCDDALIITDGLHSFDSIEIYKTEKSKVFPYTPLQPRHYHNQLKLLDDNDSETKQPKETKRKTDNLLKVIYCMARDKYDYDPTAKRNHATGLNNNGIVSTLEKYGVEISDDTIKDYLKEGTKLIDGKKLPELG